MIYLGKDMDVLDVRVVHAAVSRLQTVEIWLCVVSVTYWSVMICARTVGTNGKYLP